jgi:hypothetical protein
MPQTSISANPAAAQEGQLVHQTAGVLIISKVALEAVYPGCLVVYDNDTPSADKCKRPDATGDVTSGIALGVVLLDPTREGTDMDSYAAGEAVPILAAGEIWVLTESTATAGAAPFVRFTAAGAEREGAFRHDADTADAVALPNAVWASTAGSAGLAKVRLGVGVAL